MVYKSQRLISTPYKGFPESFPQGNRAVYCWYTNWFRWHHFLYSQVHLWPPVLEPTPTFVLIFSIELFLKKMEKITNLMISYPKVICCQTKVSFIPFQYFLLFTFYRISLFSSEAASHISFYLFLFPLIPSSPNIPFPIYL